MTKEILKIYVLLNFSWLKRKEKGKYIKKIIKMRLLLSKPLDIILSTQRSKDIKLNVFIKNQINLRELCIQINKCKNILQVCLKKCWKARRENKDKTSMTKVVIF